MYIKYKELIDKFALEVKGILHVGAHHAEEMKDYTRNGCDRNNIIWIEGNKSLSDRLKSRGVPNVLNYIVSDKSENVTFNIANNGQSSSILELEEHKKLYPHISYHRKRQVNSHRIDEIYKIENLSEDSANFLNLDIQGAELLALKGMGKILNEFDYIYTEVNKVHIYKDCCLIEELDEFLLEFGFKRVLTHWSKGVRHEGLVPSEDLEVPAQKYGWYGHGWGDAFYIKS